MQRTFAGGEIASSLYGGADPARYQSALATCRNFMVMRHGGVTNRPGSQFIAEVKDSSVRTYLLKFIYNDTDTYIIEAGAAYFRFYKEGARVVTGSVTAWSGATAYVVGDLASRSGVNYYCIAAHTNQQPPNASYWYALTSDILEIPTPYAAADLARLKTIQSGDIVTITHPSYAPRELRRTASRWTLTAISTAPTISAPTGVAATAGTAGTLVYSYLVTAVKEETYEESVASSADTANCEAPDDEAPNTVSWNAVTGAVEYNIYLDKDGNGIYGFVGVAATTSFNDIGYEPDFSVSPPVPRVLFNATGDYPSTAGYYQQRLLAAGSTNEPEAVQTSRTGSFKNFTISSPMQDDDAIKFGIAGRKISEVRHLIEAGKLVILTSTGEWVVFGDADGVLRPTAINVRQQTYYGSSHVVPIIIGNSILFNQARGGILRDLRFEEATDGYDGRDLTLYAAHLFEGVTIERMDFAQLPNSIVWVVRSDGVLLGLTYLREVEVFGWHRHDTDGTFEDVAVAPETTTPVPGSAQRGKEEDAVYVIVNRTIDGSTVRYIERFASRRIEDYRLDGCFLDSYLTYNGINDSATTMTLTTGAGWTTADEITATASASTFSAGDVGKGVTVWDPAVAGSPVRITIVTYVSPTVVRGTPNLTVPAAVRNAAKTTWSIAVSNVTGLEHLEGETVNVCANGVVITGKTVTSGEVTALGALYDVIHVGLPITADFETLDLDSAEENVRGKRKLIRAASLLVDKTRGTIDVGPDSSHLDPYAPEPGDALGSDIFSLTGATTRSQWIEITIPSDWKKPGRVFVRHEDPLPLAILGIQLDGELGG